MPHHLEVVPGEVPPWSDLSSFMSHVFRECRRLKAKPPTVEQLYGEYVQRCISRAFQEARGEVEAWRERRGR